MGLLAIGTPFEVLRFRCGRADVSLVVSEGGEFYKGYTNIHSLRITKHEHHTTSTVHQQWYLLLTSSGSPFSNRYFNSSCASSAICFEIPGSIS